MSKTGQILNGWSPINSLDINFRSYRMVPRWTVCLTEKSDTYLKIYNIKGLPLMYKMVTNSYRITNFTYKGLQIKWLTIHSYSYVSWVFEQINFTAVYISDDGVKVSGRNNMTGS